MILPIACLLLYISVALTKSFCSNPPSTSDSLAFSTIVDAVSLSIPVISASSTGPRTIKSMMLCTPASLNFFVVTGPTPGKLSNLKSSIIPYVTVLVLYKVVL